MWDMEVSVCRTMQFLVLLWFQVLSLDGTQMEWVADHLGHSFDVERTYYRIASSTIERAKIAKLLILADSGNIDGCKGKTLDELSFEGKWTRLISRLLK